MVLLDHPSASLKTFLARHPGQDFDRGGGIKLHYLDEGSGDPVVMVHGNPTWSFYYRNLAEHLVGLGEYRVVVPDHVGCGRSDKPATTATPTPWPAGSTTSKPCSTTLA